MVFTNLSFFLWCFLRVFNKVVDVNNRLNDCVLPFTERIQTLLLSFHQRIKDLQVVLPFNIFLHSFGNLFIVLHNSLPIRFVNAIKLCIIGASVKEPCLYVESHIEDPDDSSFTKADHVFGSIVQDKSDVYTALFNKDNFVNTHQRPEHDLSFVSVSGLDIPEDTNHKLPVNSIIPSVKVR